MAKGRDISPRVKIDKISLSRQIDGRFMLSLFYFSGNCGIDFLRGRFPDETSLVASEGFLPGDCLFVIMPLSLSLTFLLFSALFS